MIAHFDDDDYSAPNRLTEQIRLLTQSGKPVAGFRSMRFTDGRSWWLYTGSASYALGTSLVYRRDWWERNRFPELQIGEDNGFVGRARESGGIVTADAGEMMFATIHHGNTSPRNLRGSNWAQIS